MSLFPLPLSLFPCPSSLFPLPFLPCPSSLFPLPFLPCPSSTYRPFGRDAIACRTPTAGRAQPLASPLADQRDPGATPVHAAQTFVRRPTDGGVRPHRRGAAGRSLVLAPTQRKGDLHR
ncbi:MAG: hypothetical protein DWQ36_15130 [Acidobacteria bacterium]|nr:MAG: hypothetical protein DWQ36_15130 [Acidobacteriota bacterium]